jgi:hypothetical protein
VGTTAGPPPDDIDRIERALGWRPRSFRPAAPERGLSGTAARWIAGEAGDGSRSAFVKIGATGLTADLTRREYRNIQTIRGWFLPEVLGFDDDGSRPVLALEDLSDADWPPPWSDQRVVAVLDAVRAIHETEPPAHLEWEDEDGEADWRAIAGDPATFLALGLCAADWLTGALPQLRVAAGVAPLAGDALVHLDIRSDNLCIRDGRATVIDWNHARLANPDLDIAFWLPSLHAEGGPPPETILPDSPGLAAWVAGFFCARAGQPQIADAPHVRALQLRQAASALPWAARALGLPAPSPVQSPSR